MTDVIIWAKFKLCVINLILTTKTFIKNGKEQRQEAHC